MKTVKTASDLQRLALTKGASASVGGVRFNSAFDTVTTDRPAKAKPVAPEAVQPTAPDSAMLLSKIIELLARPTPEIKMPDIVIPEIKMPEIKMPDIQWPSTPTPTAPPAQAVSWCFKVERDVRGFMTQIVATCKPD